MRGSQVGSWDCVGPFVQPKHTSSVHQEKVSLPLDQHGLVVPGRDGPPGGLEMLSQWQGGENTALQIPDKSPEM
jgi:hypothetical protein